jgi:type IV fimbrial biogenesis protein FimT
VKKPACKTVWPGIFKRGAASVRGFTLIELMIVLVIVAVFVMIAAPSYSTLTQRTRLKSYANEVVASAYLARSEAIKRNATMTLCASADGSTCDGGGDWEQGWIVMDSNDTVIKRQQSLASGMVLFHLSSATFNTMEFQSSGVVIPAATLKLCQETPSVGVEEKLVTISVTGRPRIQTTRTGCP